MVPHFAALPHCPAAAQVYARLDLLALSVVGTDGRVLAAGPRSRAGGSVLRAKEGSCGGRPLELVLTAAGDGRDPATTTHRIRAPSEVEHNRWIDAVAHNVRLL